ncbi:zinc finger HIT domain-containing protein 1-like isoform X2 [Antedon mediterranea]|uniref:zinc finger HIT domain-containing protein 1-like isoform X2 n=1 Tax=Antedon mediterranea TaxID=105859 RepID=UPI003AF450E0
MADKRESGRIRDQQQRRILDKFTRAKRMRKQLDALEQDNFQEDPQANLVLLKKKLPQFDEEPASNTPKKKRKTRGDHFKQRFRKTFNMLLEEEQTSNMQPNTYFTAGVSPSTLPQRHFCNVCGCVSCGARYCCVKCLGTHQDTRCLKWTV